MRAEKTARSGPEVDARGIYDMKYHHSQLCFADAVQIAPAADGTNAPSQFIVLKFGRNVFTKDAVRGHFDFSEADADRIIEDFHERGKDLVIDFDHQSVCEGVQAPAAGWITGFAVTGEGLEADVNWTPRGADALATREYRYHSPVIVFGENGRPCSLHSVALTNHPALHQYAPLVAHDTPNPENQNMKEKLKKLAAMLSVTVTFDDAADAEKQEAEALDAISGRIAQLTTSAQEMEEFLALHGAKTLADVTGKIRGMVPASEKAQLEQRLNDIEAEKAVAQAFADGKLVEAQREWAHAYARKDLAAFSEFVASAPAVVPLSDKPDTRPLGKKCETLSEEERKILKNLGVSEKAFLKHRNETENKEEE